MGWDLDNIQKAEAMNLAGFSGESSCIIGKVTLSVETLEIMIYLRMMVTDAGSTYNVILG